MAETFIDFIRLHIKAGDGGAGAVAFRREAFMPRGGPAGGDGGKGGDVVFVADPKLATLLDLKYRPSIVAGNGLPGGGNDCHGRNGKSVTVRIPLGTTVVNDETGEVLADLVHPEQQWVARGGRGGMGNAHFATSRNKTPRYAQEGEPGEEFHLALELKLIAQVGLVGLPNAGKSTLLSELTAATPKIAPYPFTTLSPNLGVIEYPDLLHLTLADIPGLIEGAHHGAGLGDRFLRHIERTRILAHLVGDELGTFDPDDMLYKFDLVCQELAAYSKNLARKRQLVIISKIDLANPEDLEKTCEAFRARGFQPFCLSAFTGENLDELKVRLREIVDALNEGAEETLDAEGILPAAQFAGISEEDEEEESGEADEGDEEYEAEEEYEEEDEDELEEEYDEEDEDRDIDDSDDDENKD